MSGEFRLGKTTVLCILVGFGQVFDIVALQLHKFVQKQEEEGALTRSVELS